MFSVPLSGQSIHFLAIACILEGKILFFYDLKGAVDLKDSQRFLRISEASLIVKLTADRVPFSIIIIPRNLAYFLEPLSDKISHNSEVILDLLIVLLDCIQKPDCIVHSVPVGARVQIVNRSTSRSDNDCRKIYSVFYFDVPVEYCTNSSVSILDLLHFLIDRISNLFESKGLSHCLLSAKSKVTPTL